MYWGIGCGAFVSTVICQLQTDSRQLAKSPVSGKILKKSPRTGSTDCDRVSTY
ncbi:hypothetical protein QUB70_18785 [Microcoleus sp. A003_D6]